MISSFGVRTHNAPSTRLFPGPIPRSGSISANSTPTKFTQNRHMRSKSPSRLPAILDSFTTAQAGEVLDGAYDKTFDDNYKGRRVGIILHPTSLPGPYGSGEIGQECFRFIDWLHESGMTCWQVLPLVPPDQLFFSPYTGLDTNCGNPLLISIDGLIEDGLLNREEAPPHVPLGPADFYEVAEVKMPVLELAAQRLVYDSRFEHMKTELQDFRHQRLWVEDSALFECLRTDPENWGKVWWEWPEPIRFKDPRAVQSAREKYGGKIDEFVAIQYLFHKQWTAVKEYANSRGVKIIGDMPIYVGGHSADVWSNQHLFELSETGAPSLVSGVPPDAFSKTGQLWGTPLYNWEAHHKDKYSWWSQRLGRSFELFDETRIDHFRGFAGYWAVESDRENAMVGVWKKGPGMDIFKALEDKLGSVPIIAEDLGVITPDVKSLRESIKAPGMVVLQFAFGSKPDNTHLPHMHSENSVVYPGTHDNETSVGWYQDSCQPQEREYLKEYMNMNGDDIAWAFIREGMKSVSKTCIIMLQDVMRLDNTARMNSPGKAEDNWQWRVDDYDVWNKLSQESKELRRLARTYNRLPEGWDF